jgi:predicted NAD-dependent protein-ADP-ribosyltransferase YbiA (DUF1768 family)
MANNTKPYKIGKILIPGQWQTGIFLRYMKDDQLKEMFERYTEAKYREHGSKEPTQEEFAMAEHFRKEQDAKKRLSVSRQQQQRLHMRFEKLQCTTSSIKRNKYLLA